MNKNIIIWICILTMLFVPVFADSNTTYYNLTQYDDDETMLDFYYTTDFLLNGYFSLFMVIVLSVIPAILLIKNGSEPIDAIMYSSFIGLLFATFIYAGAGISGQASKPGTYIFIPAIVYVATVALKWYNKR